MRYLSVCSGIEAATVAWHHLGWTPVGFSEIEPFPSAVLAHHYPTVTNYGDMTKHDTWGIEHGSIDLLVGGTPCQSFSVAGLRRGLADPRGGLMLTYLEIARRLRPRWIVWENVPGVLSSNGGRDFGSFLGALGELGYGWAYRVLDAQWVRTQRHPRAVPQRRRRVFVVGCLGDSASAAKVLFESQSVLRDSTPRRKKGTQIAVDAGCGSEKGCWWDGGQVSQTLDAVLNKGQAMPEKNRFPVVLQSPWPAEVAPTLNQSSRGTGAPGYSDQELFAQGAGCLIPQPVPFTKSKRAQSVTDDETWVDGKVNPTLSLFDQGDTRATTAVVNMQGSKSSACVAIDGSSFTLNAMHGHDVHAVAFSSNMSEPDFQTDGSTPTVKVGSGLGIPSPPAVACPTLTAHNDPSRSPQSSEVTQQVAAVHAASMTVRRLTPRECERLQGFPDDYTMIPWRRKPAADCPDGPRYKALGNSMAVNCMAWIGQRISAIETNNETSLVSPPPPTCGKGAAV